MNQLYLVGGASIVALRIFLYLQSCRVLLSLFAWYKSHQFTAIVTVTMNQLYLVGLGQCPCATHFPLFTNMAGNRVAISLCLTKSHQFTAFDIHRCLFLDWEG
jgi:hypothetical protein